MILNKNLSVIRKASDHKKGKNISFNSMKVFVSALKYALL